ncbi:MAG: hypothetical protein ACRCYX_16175 [Dermatophilaceae bacterium]
MAARLGFKLFDLKDDLVALLGRPVDLVARTAINRYHREQVLADTTVESARKVATRARRLTRLTEGFHNGQLLVDVTSIVGVGLSRCG